MTAIPILFLSSPKQLEENSLIIDHPGETTVVTSLRLGWMRRRSIVVKNGSRIELSYVIADRIVQEAIYLEEGASASAKYFHTLLDSINIFSVANSDQVCLCLSVWGWVRFPKFSGGKEDITWANVFRFWENLHPHPQDIPPLLPTPTY